MRLPDASWSTDQQVLVALDESAGRKLEHDLAVQARYRREVEARESLAFLPASLLEAKLEPALLAPFQLVIEQHRQELAR